MYLTELGSFVQSDLWPCLVQFGLVVLLLSLHSNRIRLLDLSFIFLNKCFAGNSNGFILITHNKLELVKFRTKYLTLNLLVHLKCSLWLPCGIIEGFVYWQMFACYMLSANTKYFRC